MRTSSLSELIESFGNVVAVVLVQQPQEAKKYARKAAPKAQNMSGQPIRRRRRRRRNTVAKQAPGM